MERDDQEGGMADVVGAQLNVVLQEDGSLAPLKLVDLGDGTFGLAVGFPAAAGEVAVTGPLTDEELREEPVPVSGPLTDEELRAEVVGVAEENSSLLLATADEILLSLGTPALGTRATGTISNEDTVTPADEGQEGDALTLSDGTITAMFEFYTPGWAASGNVLLLPRLAAGDTVAISDGNVAVVFEFVDDVEEYAGANTPVERVPDGEVTDPTPTAVNLRAAIGESALAITASSFGDNNSTHLVNDAEGAAGNVAIVRVVAYETPDHAMMVEGMSNGQDDTEAHVGEGNIAVPTGDWPLAELESAINESALAISATLVTVEDPDDPDGPGDDYFLALENDNAGTPGNQTILVREEVEGAWVVTGMAGGSETSVEFYNELLENVAALLTATERVRDAVEGDVTLAEMGHTTVAVAALTRPDDAAVYAAGDVVSDDTAAPTAQTISVARANNGGGVIQSALLVDSANQATKGNFEVWLFDAAITAMEDNAAFDPTDAEMANLVGVIRLGDAPNVGLVTAGADGNCVYTYEAPSLAFKCGAAVQTLWWVLVVRNAYTPVAEETFTLRLGVLQD